MADEEKTELSMDEEAMLKLLHEANLIKRGNTLCVTVNGKRWHIRTTSMRQNELMANLDFDVLYWQRKLKEAQSAEEAKRLNSRIRRAYAKKAAHKVVGQWLRWVPFLYRIMAWRLNNSSEQVSATINATEAIGENKVFYLANLGSSKQALVLSTTNVGNAIEQRTQRGASAENMAKKDGLPKKEDNKSGARSASARTTRR